MEFRILGPLAVLGDHGAAVTLGGRKPRAVLAVLLLHANEPVSSERLAQALWGDDAPAGAVPTVQVHVSRLRKALGGGDVVTTTPAGYRLRVQPGELDADRFADLVERGRAALAAGRTAEAAAVLRQAAELWRGPPLADLAFEPFARTEVERLEEQRMEALELRVEADAAAGHHAELVPELRRLVAKHPTRERLGAQLMLALYRCGRQTEALDAYREARRTLAEEIGIEPGPELRAMHEAILHQDRALDLEQPAELAHELEAAASAPLAGRDAELSWLHDRWDEALAGQARLVVLAGPRGMGKTRLAAELAVDAHRAGAAVVYAAATPGADAVAKALDGAHGAARPLLLVVDDADGLDADALTVVRELAQPHALVLVTATDQERLTALEPDGMLFLKRLGSDGIGAIAALYVPDELAQHVPLERLLHESGGVPRRVHDAASRWARLEAERRVGALAGRAAEGREELRSVEDELAGGVVALQTARDLDWPEGGNGDPVVCPFKGLASFEASDARYFFGRERLVAGLVARLVGAPLLGVVGPSGSGKSSVVKAGLLPALAEGVLPGSDGWPRAVIRPGEHPLRRLRQATEGIGAPRFVLVVDQFEETFTVCRDEEERSRFIAEIVQAAEDDHGAVAVLAIRADFYGRCADYPGVARMLAANHVLVGAMRRDELRRAVVGPAQRAGLHVEPDLVDALVRDVEDEPGALPLLSTALLELWQRRDGRRVRYAAYEETGGVLGAVARLAEDGFARLDADQQALARRVLLRLAEVEPEGGVERRRLPIAALDDGSGAVRDVISLLADARLLTVSDDEVEFAHEALLREWPRLRGWIDDDRDHLRVHRSLTVAAEEWRRHGRDSGALYRGARLTEASEWAERAETPPSEPEDEFLTASVDRERRDRRGHRRRLTIAFGALALGIVVIAAVALVAISQRRDADRQKDIAVSRELAAESRGALAVDPEIGLRLALWAYDMSPTTRAVTAMREATLAFRQVGVLRADSLDDWAAGYSPDGTRAVTGGGDGRAVVWDVRAGRQAASLEAGHGAVLAASYAPAGDRIALGFHDGTVLVTDGSLRAPRRILTGDSPVHDVAFSGDGRRIAAGLEDGTVLVVMADGGGRAEPLKGNTDPVLGVDIDGDGRRVVSAGKDGTVRLWDIDGGGDRLLRPGGERQNDVAFSPDGTRILSAGDDGWIRMWRGDSATRISGEGRQLNAVAFSADGRRFAVGGDDGVTRVWSVAGGPPIAVLRGQRSRVYDVGFGSTGDRLVTAGDDGTARLWDTGRIEAWGVPSETFGFDFNRDGRLLATSSADGTVRVWDTASGSLRASEGGPPGYVAAKFSPISDTLAIPNWDASLVRTWRVGDEAARVIVGAPHAKGVESARFDPTGKRIIYVADNRRVVVRELDSGRETRFRGGPKGLLYDAVFSPDGRHIAALPESGAVPVWRADHPGAPLRTLTGHQGHTQTFDFSPDGRRIVTAGGDRTVRVWTLDGRALVMRGHEDEVTTVTFTPDGSKVLSSSDDGTLRLWDARTGDQLAILQSDESTIKDVAVSPDGRIATLGDGDVVRIFSCEVCGGVADVRARALSRSPRQLTPAEQRTYLAAAD